MAHWVLLFREKSQLFMCQRASPLRKPPRTMPPKRQGTSSATASLEREPTYRSMSATTIPEVIPTPTTPSTRTKRHFPAFLIRFHFEKSDAFICHYGFNTISSPKPEVETQMESTDSLMM